MGIPKNQTERGGRKRENYSETGVGKKKLELSLKTQAYNNTHSRLI